MAAMWLWSFGNNSKCAWWHFSTAITLCNHYLLQNDTFRIKRSTLNSQKHYNIFSNLSQVTWSYWPFKDSSLKCFQWNWWGDKIHIPSSVLKNILEVYLHKLIWGPSRLTYWCLQYEIPLFFPRQRFLSSCGLKVTQPRKYPATQISEASY